MEMGWFIYDFANPRGSDACSAFSHSTDHFWGHMDNSVPSSAECSAGKYLTRNPVDVIHGATLPSTTCTSWSMIEFAILTVPVSTTGALGCNGKMVSCSVTSRASACEGL